MIGTDKIQVAVIGDDWGGDGKFLTRMKIEIKKVLEEFVLEELDVVFTSSTAPSLVKFFPHSFGSATATDALRAQEVSLARRSDITVYINDGGWSEAKKKFLDFLVREAGALIIWTPPSVEEKMPEGGVSDEKPGVVIGKGPMRLLARMIMYIGIPSVDYLLEDKGEVIPSTKTPEPKKVEEVQKEEE